MDTLNLPKTAGAKLYLCGDCGRNVYVPHHHWPRLCPRCQATPFSGVLPESAAIVRKETANA